MSLSHYKTTTEYQAILIAHLDETQGRAHIKESSITQVMELLGLAGFTSGSAALLTLPLPEKKIGGAALLGVAAIVADLHHHLFGGKIVTASQNLFGGAAHAMQSLGVIACATLSAGGFARMVSDGGFKNPKDPRWLGVIATGGPFMAGHIMMQKDVKQWVEDHFGQTLHLAHSSDKQKGLEVPTAPFFKQLAFVIGGAHILAYGMIKSDNKSKFIGSAFMFGPSLSLGNLLWKAAQDKREARIAPRERIHYLSVLNSAEQDADQISKTTHVLPLIDQQGKLQYDALASMITKTQVQEKNSQKY